MRLHARNWRWPNRPLRFLYPYRPRFDNRKFWAVQGLVALVAALHFAIEALDLMNWGATHSPALTFVPMAMFFIPVVYAGLNFGLSGSVATAAWCSALAVPNLILFHPGPELVAEMVQLGIVDFVAVFVGQRVDREAHARLRAEEAGAALRNSEELYRSLFASSPVPVLLLEGGGGVIAEANAATEKLVGKSAASIKGLELADVLGVENAGRILEGQLSPDSGNSSNELVLSAPGDSPLLVEPMLTRVEGNSRTGATQLVLRDVTADRQRQAGLRAYAAYVVRAQEEERQRIARELHDDVVQRVILLVRQLDTLQGAGDKSQIDTSSVARAARLSAEEIADFLRGFARDLRPPSLEDLGFVTSIRRALRDLEVRSGIAGELHLAGKESRFHPDFELTVFRIAQEAIRNAEKHASPSKVDVTVSFDPRRFTLEVTDDGRGFRVPASPEGLASRGHLGLLGMRERANLIGGSLHVASRLGEGTTVSLTAPIDRSRL